jgi:hypothetical protein
MLVTERLVNGAYPFGYVRAVGYRCLAVLPATTSCSQLPVNLLRFTRHRSIIDRCWRPWHSASANIIGRRGGGEEETCSFTSGKEKGNGREGRQRARGQEAQTCKSAFSWKDALLDTACLLLVS